MVMIKEVLKNLQYTLSTIPYINSGGCGIAALTMLRFIKKHDTESNVSAVLCNLDANNAYDDAETKVENMCHLYNTNALAAPDKFKHLLPCTHVVINYNGKYIDVNGDVNITKYKTINDNVSEESLLKCINTNGWARAFDRGTNIPKIMENCGIDISDVDDNGCVQNLNWHTIIDQYEEIYTNKNVKLVDKLL